MGSSGRNWIVDPIDGTQSFIHGVPLYSLLIGIEIAGEAAVGGIHLPALGETVSAYRGGGCTWNGRRARVSEVSELRRSALTMSDFPYDRQGFTVPERLLNAAGVYRTWGDGYGSALVATGRVEVMIDPIANPWDLAAVQPILEEASGRFSDLAGQPTFRGGAGFATNGGSTTGARVARGVLRTVHQSVSYEIDPALLGPVCRLRPSLRVQATAGSARGLCAGARNAESFRALRPRRPLLRVLPSRPPPPGRGQLRAVRAPTRRSTDG